MFYVLKSKLILWNIGYLQHFVHVEQWLFDFSDQLKNSIWKTKKLKHKKSMVKQVFCWLKQGFFCSTFVKLSGINVFKNIWFRFALDDPFCTSTYRRLNYHVGCFFLLTCFFVYETLAKWRQKKTMYETKKTLRPEKTAYKQIKTCFM